jgi:hypothetical protein
LRSKKQAGICFLLASFFILPASLSWPESIGDTSRLSEPIFQSSGPLGSEAGRLRFPVITSVLFFFRISGKLTKNGGKI